MLDRPPPRDRCLAARYYIDDAVLEKERALFFRSWQFAGHAAQLRAPGDFITLSIFDQNLFLVRDRAGIIRGFYNVCPHRGHQLVDGGDAGAGRKATLTCPYHAWSFGLDGRLRGRPRQADSAGPARDDIRLFEIRVDRLVDFLFVNLDANAPPLAAAAPGLEAEILDAVPNMRAMTLEAADALGNDYRCASNWKAMIDNYLECHHCGPAHRSFDDLMDISASRFALHESYISQTAPTALKADNLAFPLDLQHDVTVGRFWWLFPNTAFGQFPGVPGFYVSRFDPVTPHLTERTSLSLTLAEPTDQGMVDRHRRRAAWSAEVVGVEDKALCENVQKGMRQRGFQQGWYVTAPDAHDVSEHAMRHFHDLYLNAMADLA